MALWDGCEPMDPPALSPAPSRLRESVLKDGQRRTRDLLEEVGRKLRGDARPFGGLQLLLFVTF